MPFELPFTPTGNVTDPAVYQKADLPIYTDDELKQLLDRAAEVTNGRIAAGNERKAKGSVSLAIEVLHEMQRRGQDTTQQIRDLQAHAEQLREHLHP